MINWDEFESAMYLISNEDAKDTKYVLYVTDRQDVVAVKRAVISELGQPSFNFSANMLTFISNKGNTRKTIVVCLCYTDSSESVYADGYYLGADMPTIPEQHDYPDSVVELCDLLQVGIIGVNSIIEKSVNNWDVDKVSNVMRTVMYGKEGVA